MCCYPAENAIYSTSEIPSNMPILCLTDFFFFKHHIASSAVTGRLGDGQWLSRKEKEALISSLCQFLWCKYFCHDRLQSTNITLPGANLGRGTYQLGLMSRYNWLWPITVIYSGGLGEVRAHFIKTVILFICLYSSYLFSKWLD